MELDLLSWTSLAVRWLHFVAGIAWIGASFYFVWLDNSLRNPATPKDGVGGELWAVHGGGFYHNEKFLVAPPELPKDLHWFKWDAYTTWLSGFALLIIVYYIGADVYLIDRSRLDVGQGGAILIGLAALVAGWIIYDFLCKSPLGKNQAVFGAVWFSLLIATTYALTHIFSDKGAFIHVGAIIGTAMVANVFFIIIPNQKKAVAAMIAGETPDPALGAAAKQRSVHNNYMTLPVLLIMISSHYPLLVSHKLNWLLLAGFAASSILIRHFFNLKHKGSMQPALAAAGAALFVVTMLVASIKPTSAQMETQASDRISDNTALTILERHCTNCHATSPTHPGFSVAPAGLSLETLDMLRDKASLVKLQAVDSNIMPLGNETGMTDRERAQLGAWLAQQKDGTHE